MNLLMRFFKYQNERFPLMILVFTTGVTVAASAAILRYEIDRIRAVAAFFTVTFFLYHIRVIDESRDSKNDAKLHPERPVQRGLISLRELFAIDLVCMALTVTISVFCGIQSIIVACAFYAFTTLAWKDFFLAGYFADKPVRYHIANSVQLILIQLHIYTVMTGTLALTSVMWINILFVWINNFIIELVRKIRIPSEDTNARDTYSASLGFTKSIVLAGSLGMASFLVYSWMALIITGITIHFLFALPILAFDAGTTVAHILLKNKNTERLKLLSALFLYIGYNSLVCVINL